MNEEYYEKIWDALREFGRSLTGLQKEEDNMQNINGQLVDVDAIEKLRGYYDAQMDASDWCDFDAETDESYDLTMQIRKSQYDTMVDSMYNLKQRLTYASRHAKELEDENQQIRNQLVEFENYILDKAYMTGWFDCLERDGELGEYENDGFIADYQLPFYSDSLNDLYELGIARYTIVGYAQLKYTEWKKEKENGIQLEPTNESE